MATQDSVPFIILKRLANIIWDSILNFFFTCIILFYGTLKGVDLHG